MSESYPLPQGLSVEEQLELAAATLNVCRLCGGPPGYVGVFVVESDPERYTGVTASPASQTRSPTHVYYGLCGDCYALPDFPARVEKSLEAEARGKRN